MIVPHSKFTEVKPHSFQDIVQKQSGHRRTDPQIEGPTEGPTTISPRIICRGNKKYSMFLNSVIVYVLILYATVEKHLKFYVSFMSQTATQK